MRLHSIPWSDVNHKRAKCGWDKRRQPRYSRLQMKQIVQRLVDGERLKDIAPTVVGATGRPLSSSGLHHRLSREFYPEIGAKGLVQAVAIGFREGWLK